MGSFPCLSPTPPVGMSVRPTRVVARDLSLPPLPFACRASVEPVARGLLLQKKKDSIREISSSEDHTAWIGSSRSPSCGPGREVISVSSAEDLMPGGMIELPELENDGATRTLATSSYHMKLMTSQCRQHRLSTGGALPFLCGD